MNTNYANCTVLDNQGDFTGYPGTQSSAFAACRTSGTTYKIAYHAESTASGACLDRNGNAGTGGIMVYSITSCNTCSSGTRVSYQWAMDHASFYGIGNMLCSDEDYTHQGTSFDDVYVCVNCTTGYSAWTDVSGQNYQSATKTDCATASYTTYYRCKKNYYSAGGYSDTDDPSKLNCQPCPPIGDLATYTEDPASSTIHECCARSGATGSDTLGSYKLKSSCCW